MSSPQYKSFQSVATVFILQDKTWRERGFGLTRFVFNLQTFALRLVLGSGTPDEFEWKLKPIIRTKGQRAYLVRAQTENGTDGDILAVRFKRTEEFCSFRRFIEKCDVKPNQQSNVPSNQSANENKTAINNNHNHTAQQMQSFADDKLEDQPISVSYAKQSHDVNIKNSIPNLVVAKHSTPKSIESQHIHNNNSKIWTTDEVNGHKMIHDKYKFKLYKRERNMLQYQIWRVDETPNEYIGAFHIYQRQWNVCRLVYIVNYFINEIMNNYSKNEYIYQIKKELNSKYDIQFALLNRQIMKFEDDK